MPATHTNGSSEPDAARLHPQTQHQLPFDSGAIIHATPVTPRSKMENPSNGENGAGCFAIPLASK